MKSQLSHMELRFLYIFLANITCDIRSFTSLKKIREGSRYYGLEMPLPKTDVSIIELFGRLGRQAAQQERRPLPDVDPCWVLGACTTISTRVSSRASSFLLSPREEYTSARRACRSKCMHASACMRAHGLFFTRFQRVPLVLCVHVHVRDSRIRAARRRRRRMQYRPDASIRMIQTLPLADSPRGRRGAFVYTYTYPGCNLHG